MDFKSIFEDMDDSIHNPDCEFTLKHKYSGVKTITETFDIPSSISNEDKEFIRSEQMRKLLSEIDINREVELIDVDKIEPTPDYWKFFSEHSVDDKRSLAASIFDKGIIYSILVLRYSSDKGERIVTLDGNERLLAAFNLLHITKDTRFAKIPCMVIDSKEVNESIIKDIILDCNITRNCDAASRIRAVAAKFIIKKNQEEQRIEAVKNIVKEGKVPSNIDLKSMIKSKDIAKDIASELKIGRSSVYKFYKLQNLIPEFMMLVETGRIGLKKAEKVSRYSKEFQQRIIDAIGIDNFEERMVAALYKPENDEVHPNSFHAIIKCMKNNTVPPFITSSVTYPREFEEYFKKGIEKLIKENPMIYNTDVKHTGYEYPKKQDFASKSKALKNDKTNATISGKTETIATKSDMDKILESIVSKTIEAEPVENSVSHMDIVKSDTNNNNVSSKSEITNSKESDEKSTIEIKEVKMSKEEIDNAIDITQFEELKDFWATDNKNTKNNDPKKE